MKNINNIFYEGNEMSCEDIENLWHYPLGCGAFHPSDSLNGFAMDCE